MTLTVDDLFLLPRSVERDRLIAAVLDLDDTRVVADLTRVAAQIVLDRLPVEPREVVRQRRSELLAEVYPRGERRAA